MTHGCDLETGGQVVFQAAFQEMFKAVFFFLSFFLSENNVT